jgi:Rieske Fe-S protein
VTLLGQDRLTDPELDPGRPARRTVVLGALAAGAAGVLAACGSDAETGGDEAGGGATTAGTSPTTEPTAGGDAGGDTGGEVLAATADVPVGGGVINADAKVVVTQPTEGDFKGFSAVCTHQSCTVSSVANGRIRCACHGSEYSVADGSVQTGPATRALPAVTVAVDGTNVVAT